MFEIKEQKKTLVTIIVLILILGLISFWRKPNFKFTDTTDYAQLALRQKQQAEAYEKYLKSLQIDPKASQELFQQLLSEQDIKKEVETALNTSQPINPPKVESSELKVTRQAGQQAVTDYLTNTIGPVLDFNRQTLGLNKGLFGTDIASIQALMATQQALLDKLVQAEVPAEAVPLQKALVSSMRSYQDLLSVSKDYAANPAADPWPKVYHDYAAINTAAATYSQEFQKLNTKYKLAELPPLHYAEKPGKNVPFVKTADAFLGFGDMVITIGDIPSTILEAVKEGLTASFSRFMGTFLQKMVQKIESNYLISNYLYYSDALVAGQYVDDYLDKYVSDTLDQQMIKKFIPQFNCGKQPQQELKTVFQAKAGQYLGFDPESVDPQDPDYYTKMARVGEFLSSPQGWQLYYQDLAAQAESEAQRAAERELTGSGLKTPRDTVNNQMSLSITSIVAAQNANINAMLNLGIINASSFISTFVAQLTQVMMNNFVFRGATAAGSSTAVLKEQYTCLAAAQMQVVLPTTNTQYQQPPPAPTTEEIFCKNYPEQCAPAGTPPRGTSD